MDSSLIQSFFNFIMDNIFYIIYGFAAVEAYLVVNIFIMMKGHEKALIDVSDNLLKGFKDAPDKDSSQSSHEKIEASLEFINNKIAQDPELKSGCLEHRETSSGDPALSSGDIEP